LSSWPCHDDEEEEGNYCDFRQSIRVQYRVLPIRKIARQVVEFEQKRPKKNLAYSERGKYAEAPQVQ
jgi:hypothetical protein